MAKKRVNELAREHDMPAKEVLEKLKAAGIEVKAAASAVDEDMARAAIAGKPLPEKPDANGQGNGRQPRAGAGPRPLGTGPTRPRPAVPPTQGNGQAPPAGDKPTGDAAADAKRERPNRGDLRGERTPGA